MRYLVRLTNDRAYSPKDVGTLQENIRTMLGSREKIGNLRVSASAVEFDLFEDQATLEHTRSELESRFSRVITLRPIDNRTPTGNEDQTLREGVRLFNEERFWEAHEVLEEIWHPAKGEDRDIIQGLILTAAAFVHFQKDEASVCISILGRALEKMGHANDFRGLNIRRLRSEVRKVIDDKVPHLVRIGWIRAKTTLQAL
jgi:uncharacterized protein